LIEGNFVVSLNGKACRIIIESFPKDGTERVIGLTVSRITVEIPYFISEDDGGNTNIGYVPPSTSSIKRFCSSTKHTSINQYLAISVYFLL
jgi:hypothetical protein